MEITDTDKAVIAEDGNLEIQDCNGRKKFTLKLKRDIMSPEEIVAASENARLEVLTGAIYCLSEHRVDLETRLEKALGELEDYRNAVRNQMEEMRQRNGEFFKVSQQNALLNQTNLLLERRVIEAEVLLGKMDSLPVILRTLLERRDMEDPKTENFQKVLSEMYELLAPAAEAINARQRSRAGTLEVIDDIPI